LLADASAILGGMLKDEAGLAVTMKSTGAPSADKGFTVQDFSGEATRGEGEHAFLRARLFISAGSVHAMVALVKDQADLGADSEAASILDSVELSSATK
ncbi:MAG TPA: hypothetical protein VFL04_06250, partial [Rectinemataceae bacterium]|nr:hypothetical protein [Rectinemataceae bacterium]